MILAINSKPRIVKVVDTMIPINPIMIPQINATPSLLNKPSDIINIPTPGIKFERGIGSKIKEENIKIKRPITLSPLGQNMNSRRGLRIFSALPV